MNEHRALPPASLQHIASCVAGYDPDALPVAQAQDFIARLVQPVATVEMRPIRDALGRVLARDIVSAIDVPAHDNSAMDGYALRGSELRAEATTRLRVVGVTGGFELEGAVLDVEVVGEAVAERVEHLSAAIVREDGLIDDDVDG